MVGSGLLTTLRVKRHAGEPRSVENLSWGRGRKPAEWSCFQTSPVSQLVSQRLDVKVLELDHLLTDPAGSLTSDLLPLRN